MYIRPSLPPSLPRCSVKSRLRRKLSWRAKEAESRSKAEREVVRTRVALEKMTMEKEQRSILDAIQFESETRRQEMKDGLQAKWDAEDKARLKARLAKAKASPAHSNVANQTKGVRSTQELAWEAKEEEWHSREAAIAAKIADADRATLKVKEAALVKGRSPEPPSFPDVAAVVVVPKSTAVAHGVDFAAAAAVEIASQQHHANMRLVELKNRLVSAAAMAGSAVEGSARMAAAVSAAAAAAAPTAVPAPASAPAYAAADQSPPPPPIPMSSYSDDEEDVGLMHGSPPTPPDEAPSDDDQPLESPLPPLPTTPAAADGAAPFAHSSFVPPPPFLRSASSASLFSNDSLPPTPHGSSVSLVPNKPSTPATANDPASSSLAQAGPPAPGTKSPGMTPQRRRSSGTEAIAALIASNPNLPQAKEEPPSLSRPFRTASGSYQPVAVTAQSLKYTQKATRVTPSPPRTLVEQTAIAFQGAVGRRRSVTEDLKPYIAPSFAGTHLTSAGVLDSDSDSDSPPGTPPAPPAGTGLD